MTGDPTFVWDSYRRFIQTYAEVVDGCQPEPFADVISEALASEGVPAVNELDVTALRAVVVRLQDVYRSLTGHQFPQDPMDQLMHAVESVLRSWSAPRAVDYRAIAGLDDRAGTAVTVQSMVFGNMGMSSGSGVGFTRDPASGADRLYVDFLLDAQGEDIVAGRHAAGDSDSAYCHDPRARAPAPTGPQATRSRLPRRPGLRVHRRGRSAVDVADSKREADTTCRAPNRL